MSDFLRHVSQVDRLLQTDSTARELSADSLALSTFTIADCICNHDA
jgi:hypothetical protein